MIVSRSKLVWKSVLVMVFIFWGYISVGQEKTELSIPEIHDLARKIVNYSPDSCLSLLDVASAKIDLMEDKDLAEAYRADNNLRRTDFWIFDDTPRAEKYLELAHDYYRKHPDNKCLAEIYCLKGQLTKLKGRLDIEAIQQSIPYFEKALEYAMRQDHPDTKAFIYYEKAITLQQTERWHESLENALQNLHYAELSGDSLSITMAYFLMGRTYNYFGLGEYSEENMAQAVSYGKGMSLLHSIVHNYANILMSNGKTDEALENYKFALQLSKKSDRQDRTLVIYTSLGTLQLNEGMYDDAAETLEAIDELATSFSSLPSTAILFKARMYKVWGRDEQVLEELEQFKEKHGSSTWYVLDVDVYKGVAELYSELGRAEEAALFFEKWGSVKDSLLAYSNRSQLGELKKLYLNERAKNEEITLKNEELRQSRKSQANMGITLMAFLVVGGGATYYIRMRGLKENQKLKIALKAKQLEQFIQVQENERQRLARELHDGIGQSLAALKLQLQFDDNMQYSKVAVDRVDALCKEVRTLSHQMMPLVLRENGLEDAIKRLLQVSFGTSEIEADLVTSGLHTRLPDKVEIHLYRIAQELVSNILKHANATKVGVQLLLRKNTVILIVEDNGDGFEVKPESDGIGISNIHSRVEAIDGEVKITSSSAEGTYVHIAIPIKTQLNKKTA